MTDVLLRLPWPPSKTSKNGSQGDWRGKASAAKAYKRDCWAICKEAGVRPMGCDKVNVEVTFCPPKNFRYDLDNMLARAKQGLDAVSDAIGVDDADWREMTLKRGEKVAGGCILVHVTPV